MVPLFQTDIWPQAMLRGLFYWERAAGLGSARQMMPMLSAGEGNRVKGGWDPGAAFCCRGTSLMLPSHPLAYTWSPSENTSPWWGRNLGAEWQDLDSHLRPSPPLLTVPESHDSPRVMAQAEPGVTVPGYPSGQSTALGARRGSPGHAGQL